MRTSPRSIRRRLLLAPVALVLAAGTLAGCGDDSSDSSSSADAGSDTSTSTSAADSDFCTVLGSGGDIQDGADVAAFVKKLKAIDAPEDIPDDAAKGYDVYLGVLGDVDPDASAKELQNMQQKKLSKTEQTEVQSFLTYAQSTCAPAPSGSAETPSEGAQ